MIKFAPFVVAAMVLSACAGTYVLPSAPALDAEVPAVETAEICKNIEQNESAINSWVVLGDNLGFDLTARFERYVEENEELQSVLDARNAACPKVEV